MIKMITTILMFFITLTSNADVVFTVAYENKLQFPYYMGTGVNGLDVLDENPGVAGEMVKSLELEIENLKVEFVRLPWKRCLKQLEEGKVDGIFNASFKEERLSMGHYPWKDNKVDTSRRLTTISYSFYRKIGGKFDWNGIKLTRDNFTIIGAPLGYSIISDLENMNLTVSKSHSTYSNLKMLQKGRVSAIALQTVTGDYYLRTSSDFYDVEKIYPPIKIKPYYLMISHQFKNKYPELSEQIWDAIAKLRKERMDILLEKYFKLPEYN